MDEPLPQSEFFKVTINRDTLNGGSSSSRKRTEAEAFGTDDYIALGFEETSGQEEEDEADLEAVHEVLRGLHGRERDSTAEPVSKRLRGEVDTRPPWIADEASFSGESEVSMRYVHISCGMSFCPCLCCPAFIAKSKISSPSYHPHQRSMRCALSSLNESNDV